MKELTIEQVQDLLDRAEHGQWSAELGSDWALIRTTYGQYVLGERVQPKSAPLLAAAPDLARLAITLHAQLQQEREGREAAERELTELRGEEGAPWDKDADQEAICTCGHTYYMHFDSYEDMEPIGCKYCLCGTFTPSAQTEATPDSGEGL